MSYGATENMYQPKPLYDRPSSHSHGIVSLSPQLRNDCSGTFGKCHMDGSFTSSERWEDGQRLGDF